MIGYLPFLVQKLWSKTSKN